jgi:hypothetical protein
MHFIDRVRHVASVPTAPRHAGIITAELRLASLCAGTGMSSDGRALVAFEAKSNANHSWSGVSMMDPCCYNAVGPEH